MGKISAQKIYLGSGEWINNGVIELENENISRVFSLNDCQVEPESTTFYNGIITPSIPLNETELKNHFINQPQTPFHQVFDQLYTLHRKSGKISFLIWENINFETLKVTKDTKITQI